MAVGNPVAGDGVPKTLRDKLRLTCIRFSSRWAGRLLGKWLAAMALGAGSASVISSKEPEDKVQHHMCSYVKLAFGFLRAGRGACYANGWRLWRSVLALRGTGGGRGRSRIC